MLSPRPGIRATPGPASFPVPGMTLIEVSGVGSQPVLARSPSLLLVYGTRWPRSVDSPVPANPDPQASVAASRFVLLVPTRANVKESFHAAFRPLPPAGNSCPD